MSELSDAVKHWREMRRRYKDLMKRAQDAYSGLTAAEDELIRLVNEEETS